MTRPRRRRGSRTFVERRIAHLEVRCRVLARVSLCPWRIPTFAVIALVLSIWENRY